jgi:NTP pyrophosphatase (non-canonical NTP hydrolase)
VTDSTTTIENLKQQMAEFVRVRDWEKYHRPKNLAMSVAIEAAELMEHFQWLTHEEAEGALLDEAVRQEVAGEMADVLAYLLSLANAMGIDLSAAFDAKMRRTELKYPADLVRGHYKRPDEDNAS